MNPEIKHIYDGVMEIITKAYGMVDEQSLPDTDLMKSEIERLCAAINALPLEKRLAYADDLGALFNALGELETQLKQKRDEVGARLSETSTHKAASQAYTKTENIDPRPKKSD